MRTVLIVVAMLLLGGCTVQNTPEQPRAAQVMFNHNESTDLISASRLTDTGRASAYRDVNARTHEQLVGYSLTRDYGMTCGQGFNTTKFTVYRTMVTTMAKALIRCGRGCTAISEPVKFDPRDISTLSKLQVEIAQNCRKGPGRFSGRLLPPRS